MVHVVQGHPVQQEQVLVRSSSSYVHARRSFGARLHARQQLQGLNQVVLAEQGRDVFDLGDGYFHGAHLRSRDAHFRAVSYHRYFFQYIILV